MLFKACKLVGHFSHSTLATTKVHKVQECKARPQRYLIRDVVTRWNSTYMMLDRLIAEQTNVYTILEDRDFTLATDCKKKA